MKRSLAGVDGLLFDIDGVLLLGEEVIPGAAETVSALPRPRYSVPLYDEHDYLLSLYLA